MAPPGGVATLDGLTGLRNQRALSRELAQRAALCSRSAPLAVVVLDFDRLEEVNDRYDRTVGDAVLRAGAEAARDEAPSPRLAFRYGDDGLVLLVPGDEEDGRELAERLRARIAAQNSDLPAVTVSCGVAAFDSPVQPAVALERAGPALRAAKRAGGNRVALATESALDRDASEEGGDGAARRAALAMAVASLEARDRTTADHSDDVVTLCESIGRRLGLSDSEREHLTAGAQLHDVGKVAVSSEILNKPGPLDDHEWAIMREHTVIGERILRSVPEMAAVATLVRHSHERWDGSGYPDGLVGEEIPLASRIILCADAFHAIRSDRPYRLGRSADEAIAEVRSWAGRQFDPRVVEALVAVARDVRGRVGAATALPRSRRLAVLLAALALGGGGSAYAASEGVRDAVGGAVEVLVPGTSVEPAGADSSDFSLRPLAEVSSIDPSMARTVDHLPRPKLTPLPELALELDSRGPELAPLKQHRDRTPAAAVGHGAPRARGNPHGGPPAVGNPHGAPPARGNPHGGPPAVGNPHVGPRVGNIFPPIAPIPAPGGRKPVRTPNDPAPLSADDVPTPATTEVQTDE